MNPNDAFPTPNPDDVVYRDDSGTQHWFAIVPHDDPTDAPFQLRYFRALQHPDGFRNHDHYPVMPLHSPHRADATYLFSLEGYLASGQPHIAQTLAFHLGQLHDLDFPHPRTLPALDPRPDYYFGTGLTPTNAPALEVVKTWLDGPERRFDSLTLAEYPSFDHVADDELRLEHLRSTHGLPAAMRAAEQLAIANGFLDPARDDPRLFFAPDAPPDPFTTLRAHELAHPPTYAFLARTDHDHHWLDVVKAWDDHTTRLSIPLPDAQHAALIAEQAFALQATGDLDTAMHLVERAACDAGILDPLRRDPRLFTDGPPDPFTTLRQLDLDAHHDPDRSHLAQSVLSGRDWFQFVFAHDPDRLLTPLDDTVNYALTLQQVDPWTTELALEKFWREPQGLIGSAERTLHSFDSLDLDAAQRAAADRDALLDTYHTHGLTAFAQHALHIAQSNHLADPDLPLSHLFRHGPFDRFVSSPNFDPVLTPHWDLHALPVTSPDGQPLGLALHLARYPTLEHDPHRRDLPPDAPVQLLEVAHFNTQPAADRFIADFHSFLRPGLLEGPELAQEVARMEGFPLAWQTLSPDQRAHLQHGTLTLTRDPADWRPFNPHAERDARIAAEGLYTDPIQGLVKLDEGEDEPKVEPVSPDFDL